MELDPEKLQPSERYKLLVGCVTPRPIAFISSVSPGGQLNLAPYSFFNAAGSTPMSLMFCAVTTNDSNEKDTLRNCAPTEEGGVGQFVVNVAVEGYARQMAATSESLPHGHSEFEMAGFTPAASKRVRPPRVEQSPVSFECETTHVIRLAPGVPTGGTVVIGRVVHIWIRRDLVNDKMHVDHEKLTTIGRMGGKMYTRTRERFELTRGHELLDADPPFPEDVGAAKVRGAED